jgi:two-component system nitrogen regulation response regulator GlnG
MVGTSLGIQRVRRDVELVADLDTPVLIRGETGSGKELVARALHQCSPRRERPFVSVNLGAVPKELAAAELFGVTRGAYTGAVKDQKGLFLAAHGGTLFLDEVGEAPPEVQVMLLRVLQSGELCPVGSQTPVRVDVRVVSATDAQLEQQISEGRFKEPLLYRLAGYTLQVPPLRERREDIGLLFHHFARKELAALPEEHRPRPAQQEGAPWLPAALASRLVRHRWPGNIRQLQNVSRQLIIRSRGLPTLQFDPWLEQELEAPGPRRPTPAASQAAAAAEEPVRKKLTDFTDEQIAAVLEANHWTVKKAAEQLCIARSTLTGWIERNEHIGAASRLSAEALTRGYQECQGDLEALARHLRISRWALARRLKELGLLQPEHA